MKIYTTYFSMLKKLPKDIVVIPISNSVPAFLRDDISYSEMSSIKYKKLIIRMTKMRLSIQSVTMPWFWTIWTLSKYIPIYRICLVEPMSPWYATKNLVLSVIAIWWQNGYEMLDTKRKSGTQKTKCNTNCNTFCNALWYQLYHTAGILEL